MMWGTSADPNTGEPTMIEAVPIEVAQGRCGLHTARPGGVVLLRDETNRTQIKVSVLGDVLDAEEDRPASSRLWGGVGAVEEASDQIADRDQRPACRHPSEPPSMIAATFRLIWSVSRTASPFSISNSSFVPPSPPPPARPARPAHARAGRSVAGRAFARGDYALAGWATTLVSPSAQFTDFRDAKRKHMP
jgi:hypothetical protein